MPRTKRKRLEVDLPVPLTRELSASAPLTFQARPNPVERRNDGIGVTPPLGEVGVADTRLNVLSGATLFPFNPDELTRAKGGLRIYDEMRRDEQVKAALFFKKAAILGPGWQLRARGDTNEEKQLAKTLTEDLETLDGVFDDDLFEMLSSIDYGYSVSELIWADEPPASTTSADTPKGPRIRLKAIKTRAPHAIDFRVDPFGNVLDIVQLQASGRVRLPPDKFIHLVHNPEFSNPYGRSDLYHAYLCYSEDTEILTETGWKGIASVTMEERLATLNPDTDCLEYHQPTRLYRYPYRGKMFHQGGRFIDFCVTPNHRMWVQRPTADHFEFIAARDLPKIVRYKRNAKWEATDQDWFIVPSITIEQRVANGGRIRSTVVPEKRVPMDAWLRFFGIWLAEGHAYRSRQCVVGITQNRGPKLDQIREWVTAAGFHFSESIAGKLHRLTISSRQLFEYLRQFGKSGERHIPAAIKTLSARQLRILLEAMNLGDGNTQNGYATISKRLADDVQEVALKAGFASVLKSYSCASRMGSAPVYQVSYNTRRIDATLCNGRRDRREWIDYDGTVYCVEVPNHLVYVRRNGKAGWCGNSWFYKKNIQQFWMIWMEMLSNPPVVGTFPKGDDDRATTVRAMLAKLQARTAMTVPEGWDISLLESTRTPEQIFIVCIDRLDMAIARALLVPEKTGFAGGSVRAGSFALANVQADSFMYVLKLISRRLQETVQEQVINRMAQWEAPGVPAPEFLLLPTSENSTLQIADTWIRAVTGRVALSELEDENHLRELLGFPKREQRAEDALVADLTGTTPDVVPQPIPGAPGARPNKAAAGAVAGVGVGTKPGASRQPIGIAGQTTVVTKRMAETLPSRAEAERTVSVPETFWRSLTPLEERCDMAEKRTLFESRTPVLARTIGAGVRTLVRDVASRAKRLVGTSPAKVRTLTANQRIVARLRRAMVEGLRSAYDTAAKQARGELRRAKTQMAEEITFEAGLIGQRAEQYFQARAFQVTGVLEADVLQAAQNVLLQTLKQDKTDRQIAFELDQALGDFLPEEDAQGNVINVPARLETIARTQLADVVNEARYGVFTDPDLEGFVEALTYSAVLDSRTTEGCRAWDKVTRAVDDPVWYGPPDVRPPNHWNCRSILIPVTAVDPQELTPDGELPSISPVIDPFK